MDDNVDVEFLRINSPGFQNAENNLLTSGWKEKRSTRATTKDIQRSYFVYLAREKAKELQRSLTRNEMAELEAEALELKDTKMYVKPRVTAAAMNNSEEYAEEEVFIPEKERLEMIKRIHAAERPATAAPKINKIWGQIRSPPKARFPNVALNLPNNSDENYKKNAVPLNNILRNLNKLNIGNRNRNRKTLKRKRSLSLNGQRKSHKRSRYMNAPSIRRFKRRGSKFSNLPRSTRKKYMRRLSRINRN